MKSFVSVSNVLHGYGNVELLLLFCGVISGSKPPYHAEFLVQRLMRKIELWPVDLEPKTIRNIVAVSYDAALRKHIALNSRGPLPNGITYYTHYNTARYRPNISGKTYGMTITLDLGMSVLLVQGPNPESVLTYSNRGVDMLGPFSIETDRVLLPSEVCNIRVPLGMIIGR